MYKHKRIDCDQNKVSSFIRNMSPMYETYDQYIELKPPEE